MGFWNETYATDVSSIEDLSAAKWRLLVERKFPGCRVVGVQLEGDKEWADPKTFCYGPGCLLNCARALKDGYVYLQIRHPA